LKNTNKLEEWLVFYLQRWDQGNFKDNTKK